jgi:NADH-quinone oxidoreductase subunit M
VLLTLGQMLVARAPATGPAPTGAVVLLATAILIRSGAVPFHCWMTELFEHASFGAALMFVTPMVGIYGAARLLVPVASDAALHGVAILSLITAIYAAGMALVQADSRRFFCYMFLSHSSLVLVGFELATPIGITGALCLWMSVALALTGFGLTLRAVESRVGRVSLTSFHGLYEHAPLLGGFFLLTGLASIGFPGTIGFVGAELLVEGVVDVYPLIGLAVVIAAALNGIAVLQVYFRVFTGKQFTPTISLRIRWQERTAVIALAALILGGGLLPQPGLASRRLAATQLIESRRQATVAVKETGRTPAHTAWLAGDAPLRSDAPPATPPPTVH